MGAAVLSLRLGPVALLAMVLLGLVVRDAFSPSRAEQSPAPSADERLRYHRAAAQRTLKAVGTYAAFARRGARRHLPLIPRTLGRCLDHLRRLPEAAALTPRLAERWGPALEPSGR